MAKLAIKGHAIRGNEVIEILEMFGGRNPTKLQGNASSCGYYIDSDGNIAYRYSLNEFIQFTIEEFLEIFPYKIGDRVKTIYGKIGIVSKPIWSNRDNCIRYELKADTDSFFYFTNELQPYEEETMEETIIDTIKESANRYRIKVNYQFDIEVDEGEYYAVRRKPQYPKNYEECCKILNIPSNGNIACVGNWVYGGEYLEKHLDRLRKFQQLLICRDAYWKMAGDQMGLGKPWKPNWTNNYQKKCTIGFYQGEINLTTGPNAHYVLAFPTAEIRDFFYENFKDLIELCKELL